MAIIFTDNSEFYCCNDGNRTYKRISFELVTSAVFCYGMMYFVIME